MNICTRCKLEKEQSEFNVNKVTKTGFHTVCKHCRKEQNSALYSRNISVIREKQAIKRNSRTLDEKITMNLKNKMWHRDNVAKRLFIRAKDRARKTGLECNITEDDIIIPELCPLLNVPFIWGTRNSKWYTYSLDRIDNSKGYVKGNVQVITYLANTMKSKATKEELLTFSKNIIEFYKEDDIV